MKPSNMKILIALVVGAALGAGGMPFFGRHKNEDYLIRPALVSRDQKERNGEFLIQGPGWVLPLKVAMTGSELRMMLPGTRSPGEGPAVHVWLEKHGVRSIAVANNPRHGVTIEKSANEKGLFDRLVVQTPLEGGDKTTVRMDSDLDGVFENDMVAEK